jgi:hypothetical protein
VSDEVVVKGYGTMAKDCGHDAATVPEHSHLITLQGKEAQQQSMSLLVG